MEKSQKTKILREEYPLNLMKAMEAAKTPHRGVFGVVPQPRIHLQKINSKVLNTP